MNQVVLSLMPVKRESCMNPGTGVMLNYSATKKANTGLPEACSYYWLHMLVDIIWNIFPILTRP